MSLEKFNLDSPLYLIPNFNLSLYLETVNGEKCRRLNSALRESINHNFMTEEIFTSSEREKINSRRNLLLAYDITIVAGLSYTLLTQFM